MKQADRIACPTCLLPEVWVGEVTLLIKMNEASINSILQGRHSLWSNKCVLLNNFCTIKLMFSLAFHLLVGSNPTEHGPPDSEDAHRPTCPAGGDCPTFARWYGWSMSNLPTEMNEQA
jgi:hypothetical protein